MESNGIEVRRVRNEDKSFWLTLDKHLLVGGFEKKVEDGQGYVSLYNQIPTGILRYNLFWDNMPFCNLLYVAEEFRDRGCGRKLMEHWEDDMKKQGFELLLTSTRSDEQAQFFYRKLGYVDCGELKICNQPPEIFLSKKIR